MVDNSVTFDSLFHVTDFKLTSLPFVSLLHRGHAVLLVKFSRGSRRVVAVELSDVGALGGRDRLNVFGDQIFSFGLAEFPAKFLDLLDGMGGLSQGFLSFDRRFADQSHLTVHGIITKLPLSLSVGRGCVVVG